jgi:glycosyltransferase involved in cell wall biosynthesis
MLLIAGGTWPPESYVDKLRRLAEADPSIILRAERIADEEIQLYLNAADVMVYPFREVLTSSSVIMAMSFGRPVIVPRMGCLPELVGPDAGFIYEPGDVADLEARLKAAAAAGLPAMGAAAARRANLYTWGDLAHATLKVYQRQ